MTVLVLLVITVLVMVFMTVSVLLVMIVLVMVFMTVLGCWSLQC